MWGAPRIHGELLKLGIEVAQSTGAKYLGRQRKPLPNLGEPFWPIMWSSGLDRLFHGSNGDVPGFVCLRRTVACSTSHSALPCDGAPDPGVDNTTASGSVSVGPSTEISAARSRCDLWLRVRRHHERHGCGGSGNGTASALAKSIRRTAGGFHPARMSGPHHCVEREIVAPDSAKLFCLLQLRSIMPTSLCS